MREEFINGYLALFSPRPAANSPIASGRIAIEIVDNRIATDPLRRIATEHAFVIAPAIAIQIAITLLIDGLIKT